MKLGRVENCPEKVLQRWNTRQSSSRGFNAGRNFFCISRCVLHRQVCVLRPPPPPLVRERAREGERGKVICRVVPGGSVGRECGLDGLHGYTRTQIASPRSLRTQHSRSSGRGRQKGKDLLQPSEPEHPRLAPSLYSTRQSSYEGNSCAATSDEGGLSALSPLFFCVSMLTKTWASVYSLLGIEIDEFAALLESHPDSLATWWTANFPRKTGHVGLIEDSNEFAICLFRKWGRQSCCGSCSTTVPHESAGMPNSVKQMWRLLRFFGVKHFLVCFL